MMRMRGSHLLHQCGLQRSSWMSGGSGCSMRLLQCCGNGCSGVVLMLLVLLLLLLVMRGRQQLLLLLQACQVLEEEETLRRLHFVMGWKVVATLRPFARFFIKFHPS